MNETENPRRRPAIGRRVTASLVVALAIIELVAPSAHAATDGPLNLAALVLPNQTQRPGHWVEMIFSVRNLSNRPLYLYNPHYEGAAPGLMLCNAPFNNQRVNANSALNVNCQAYIPTWYTAPTLRPMFQVSARRCENAPCTAWWRVTDRATIFITYP